MVQADLIRITGQDKRSVPARTKKLHENGYIEKLPIILKSAKTSLLVLKRFADVARTQFGSREPAEEPKEYGLGRYLDHDSLIKQAIGVTKVHQTILWDDLKRTVVSNRP